MAEQRARFDRLKGAEAAPRVVSAFNLFQTPAALADRLALLLDQPRRVLEPSAGLGRLYAAIRGVSNCPVVMVDVSPDCCRELRTMAASDRAATVTQADFLTLTPEAMGTFDGVLMNPPFKNGTDIKHIRHAVNFLTPTGRLVALCANGPRQREQLKPLATKWIGLPAGTFRSEGTDVAAAIVVIDRAASASVRKMSK